MQRMKERRTFLLGAGLTLVTLALYWPVVGHEFVVLDDNLYVTENAWVQKGVCWESVKWALTTTDAANWHPVTWISHLVDSSLYGRFAGGHHLTNVVFHALNALLVFLLWRRLTGRAWLSWTVAALFAWHPLHVESVAWVSERKDVLSTFFFLLMLLAYAKYAETQARAREEEHGQENATTRPPDPSRPNARPAPYYLLALSLFALGLMSKPMLVTTPLVLLLLDFWPLRRFGELSLSHFWLNPQERARLVRLLWEKLPFCVLALGSCVITIMAQHAGGAIKSVEEVPVTLRLLNAFTAYARYLGQAVYPSGLCAFYPLSLTPPIAPGILSAAALMGVTWLAVRIRAAYPWVLVGWLWFLGTLVPVIGLVQVGAQAMADRYTYIPLIGVFVAGLWTIDHRLTASRIGSASAAAAVVIALALCLGLTRHQLGYWQDSVTLCERAVSVTGENAVAENNLGVALAERGQQTEAIRHYREALRFRPDYPRAHYNLGIQLAEAGRPGEAALHFSEALTSNPQNEILHNNLGVVLVQQKKFTAGIEQFQQAIRLNPQYPKPYLNLGMACQSLGDPGGAVTNYNTALKLDPAWPEALDKLALLLATCPQREWRDPSKAIEFASRAVELTRQQLPGYLRTLGVAYAAAEQFAKAITTDELARSQAMKVGPETLVALLDRELAAYRQGQLPGRDYRLLTTDH